MTKQLVLSFLEKKLDVFLVFYSDFPLSIVLVGVGDGPWDNLIHFNDNRRWFDKFQFVDFIGIMLREMLQGDKEDEFTWEGLMKIPTQHDAIIIENVRIHNVRCSTTM
ncbi:E3 ubiquitin-protein ligase RGLG1 [Zea mays]|uniref:E3 ubiquitin-protein ligase RGLG1 n=1 Tax=Zea mays TaxID=4577 RepID=A0A1D6MV70_MAIZE|nr:E3 ubiquitin-protein ligase RGLG1 [Zea mays]